MTIRDALASAIIFVFLLVTFGIMACIPLGLTSLDGAKAMLEAWAAAYSLLVGAVVGAYFPRNPGGTSR